MYLLLRIKYYLLSITIMINHLFNFFIANLTLSFPFSKDVVALKSALKFPLSFDYKASLKYSPKYKSETP